MATLIELYTITYSRIAPTDAEKGVSLDRRVSCYMQAHRTLCQKHGTPLGIDYDTAVACERASLVVSRHGNQSLLFNQLQPRSARLRPAVFPILWAEANLQHLLKAQV